VETRGIVPDRSKVTYESVTAVDTWVQIPAQQPVA
jgi:hypothetical protein